MFAQYKLASRVLWILEDNPRYLSVDFCHGDHGWGVLLFATAASVKQTNSS